MSNSFARASKLIVNDMLPNTCISNCIVDGGGGGSGDIPPDSTLSNPEILSPDNLHSSKSFTAYLDFPGDIDYYEFTNLGGIYDFYSTGYKLDGLDTKASLYVCNGSCNNLVFLYSNDDYGNSRESLLYNNVNMGARDFGFRLPLNTIGFAYTSNYGYNAKYILEVSAYSSSATGFYSVYITRHTEINLSTENQIISNKSDTSV